MKAQFDSIMTYRVANWIIALNYCGILFFISLSCEAFLTTDRGRYILLTIFGSGAIINILSAINLHFSKVYVSDTTVRYQSVFKAFEVSLEDVRDVFVVNGFIILDTGKIPRPVIPNYFKNSRGLVRSLRGGHNRN